MQLKKRYVVGIALVALALALSTGCTRSADVSRVSYDIATGDRVRVALDDDVVTSGWVTSIDDSALHINPGGRESSAVELQSIRSLKRYRGQSNRRVEGLFLGAVAGAAVGVVIWRNTEGEESTRSSSGYLFGAAEPDGLSAGPILLGAVVGGSVGVLVGYAIRYERWQTVPMTKYHVEVEPTHDGGRAGVLWEF